MSIQSPRGFPVETAPADRSLLAGLLSSQPSSDHLDRAIIAMEETKIGTTVDVASGQDVASGEYADVAPPSEHLQRRLGGKEVQLFAIGGAIGSGLSCLEGWHLV